jgi:predicted transcriptional regulator
MPHFLRAGSKQAGSSSSKHQQKYNPMHSHTHKIYLTSSITNRSDTKMGASNSKDSDKEFFSTILDKLEEINTKVEEINTKVEEVITKVEDVNTKLDRIDKRTALMVEARCREIMNMERKEQRVRQQNP